MNEIRVNIDKMIFKSVTESNLNFNDIFNRIYDFVKKDPINEFEIAVGTDSQVHSYGTKFSTGVGIRKNERCIWVCKSNNITKKKYKIWREKIYEETSITRQVYDLIFTPEKIEELYNLILPYIDKGANISLQAHLDIGKKGKTRLLINEMKSIFIGTGIDPIIKPDSYIASYYANRYTK